MRVIRWTAYALVLAWLCWLLFGYWQAGALSTWSFWILGAVAGFEAFCVFYLFGGFRRWSEAHRQGETFEARKAENRLPKKRFGNAPKGM